MFGRARDQHEGDHGDRRDHRPRPLRIPRRRGASGARQRHCRALGEREHGDRDPEGQHAIQHRARAARRSHARPGTRGPGRAARPWGQGRPVRREPRSRARAARPRSRRRGRRARPRARAAGRVVEQMRLHRLGDPRGVGVAEPHAEAPADDHALDVDQVLGRGDTRPERDHGAVDQVVGELVAALERARPDAARQAGAPVLLHQLEEVCLAPLRRLARALPSRRARRRPPCSPACRTCSARRSARRPCGRSRRRRRVPSTPRRRG